MIARIVSQRGFDMRLYSVPVLALVLILGLALPLRAQSTDPCAAPPSVDSTFTCLFNIFPRSQGSADNPSIGWALAQVVAKNGGSGPIASDGPLVIVNGYGVFVYDGKQASAGKLLDHVLTRNDPATGFVQATALSHIGPALAYLAALKADNSPLFDKLLSDLEARIAHAASQLKLNPDWISKLDAPSWKERPDEINAMMTYGMWMALDYVQRVRAGKVKNFDAKSVAEDFYNGGDKRYEVPFNNVMIGTFMLAALNSVQELQMMIANNTDTINWADARVVVHMPIGTNYGAGLTLSTNQLAAALPVLSDGKIGAENILIMPYAVAPCTKVSVITQCPLEVFTSDLDAATYGFYSQTAWLGVYNRTQIARNAFYNVDDIETVLSKQIPGDYPLTSADDIDAFMMRLKYSLINGDQLLSNSVGFWLPGALKANGWDTSTLKIPGVNAGFPKGVKRYPKPKS